MAELNLGQGNRTSISMCLSINMVYEKYLYQYKLYIIIRKTCKNEKTNKQTKK